jgi:hypothetical protein
MEESSHALHNKKSWQERGHICYVGMMARNSPAARLAQHKSKYFPEEKYKMIIIQHFKGLNNNYLFCI